MRYKILTQNGANNTNIDGARAEHFAAGMRSGIIKGSLNECYFGAYASNVIGMDTGVLLISGHPIVIIEDWTKTFSSMPSSAERRSVVAEIVVNDNSVVSFRVFDQLSSVTLRKDNMFEYENGGGIYQVEIGRFTLTTAGLVEDVVRTLDVITGGTGGSGDGSLNIGTVTTTTLDAGLDAEVDIEQRVDPQTHKIMTDFSFAIPKGRDGAEVDSQLSTSSENPVQNKVITNALNNKADASDLSQYAKKNDATQTITTASITSNLTRTKGTESVIPTGDSYDNPSNELTKTVTSSGGTVNLQHGDLNVVTESGKTMKLNNNEVATTDQIPNLLDKVYPVGSIYTSVVNTSPASFLGGTWEQLPADKALWTATSGAGDTISAGLPNIDGEVYNDWGFVQAQNAGTSGAMTIQTWNMSRYQGGYSSNSITRIGINAHNQNGIYGNSSTVQPPAYKIYAWKRTA